MSLESDSRLLVPNKLDCVRRYPIGFVSAVPSEATTCLRATAMVPYRPTHLVVSEISADSFLLDCMLVGHFNASASSDPLPASVFSLGLYRKFPVLWEVQSFDVDTISPGQPISLLVRNMAKETKVFDAVLWGRAIE